MGYDILIYPARPLADGKYQTVKDGPVFLQRAHNLTSFFNILEPYGVKKDAEAFAWIYQESDRENYGSSSLPSSVLFAPSEIVDSLDHLRKIAKENLVTQDFRFLVSEDGKSGINFSKVMVYAKNGIRHLTSDQFSCIGVQFRDGQVPKKYDFLETFKLGDELLSGHIFFADSHSNFRTKEWAESNLINGEPDSRIYLEAGISFEDLDKIYRQIQEVCNYAKRNNYLIDVIHSY